MPILAISTVFRETKIAIIKDDLSKVLTEKSWVSDNSEAEKLMPEIAEALKSQNLDFKDLLTQIVIKGPGSFTGLRIGIVVANTLKYLLKNNLYSINTFEYLWSAFAHNHDTTDTALLLYAGQGGLYLSKSNYDLNENDISLLPLSQIEEALKGLKIKNIFGEISAEQKALLKDFNYIELHTSFGENMRNILGTRSFQNEDAVSPLYIKPPAITQAKNKIFNKQ